MSDDETRELPPVAAADQNQEPGAADREPGTPMAGDADTAAQGAAVERPTTELPKDLPTSELPTTPPAQPPRRSRLPEYRPR